MRTILVLIDSLNRHMLRTYNPDTWVQAKNLDRFADENLVFENHYLGSAPCMPARRDIFTGRLNFLERGWSGLEPFDKTLTAQLRDHGVFTHMETDHYHYLERGGENFCQSFDTWHMHRGQEMDPYVSRVDARQLLPNRYLGKAEVQNLLNRTLQQSETDYPTPKTFQGACDWIEANRTADDYFLMVEAFDPHEPFDCPDAFLEPYHDTYKGPFFDWSPYAPVSEPNEAIVHLRKKYAATLSMTDKWFGRLIDKLKALKIYDDTLILVTTDHGHMLGEHGYTGKNYMHVYNELAHLPLFIHLPGDRHRTGRVRALTQNIDLMPTILEHHGIEIPSTVRGKSLYRAVEGTVGRSEAIFGWHGKAVNVTDGKYTYFRAPASSDNQPCFQYFAIPMTLNDCLGTLPGDQVEPGYHLKYTDYPVSRLRLRNGLKTHWFQHGVEYIKENLLFDIVNDPAQRAPICNAEIERTMIQKMIRCMEAHDCPDEQYIRIGVRSGGE